MEQLELFNDKPIVKNGKLTTTYEINWHNIIGKDSDMANIKGYDKLTDKAQECLKYLYINHYRPEDGFIPAKKLAGVLGYFDTREVRAICAEIDDKTDLVIYSSQHGYKLAGSDTEIEMAVRFALAPALTTIKRVIAKSKNASKAKMLQGYIGNIEKLYGGNAQGQLEADDNMELREVNHYPESAYIDDMPQIDDRAKFYKENKR